MRSPRTVTVVLALALAAGLTTGGCAAAASSAVPSCAPGPRLALIAQSVPTASYVPCRLALPRGWRSTAFTATSGSTSFELLSDRASGRPVRVRLQTTCGTDGASPTVPRAEGVRTSVELRSIDPRFAGTMFDVFAGGCVTYDFDFEKGPHIGLMEDLDAAVGLYPRRDLRVALQRRYNVELDP